MKLTSHMHCVLQSVLKVSPCKYVVFPTKQFAANELEREEMEKKKKSDSKAKEKNYENEMF